MAESITIAPCICYYFSNNTFFLRYRVVVSTKPSLENPELILNVNKTKLVLPKDKLSPGRPYYVGVSLVDQDGYSSPLSGPISIEVM